MAKIEYTAAIPEKPHVLHVGLSVTEDGQTVIHEVPVRKVAFEKLTTAARKLTYVQECHEFHFEGGEKARTRREKWDADDKVEAEAKFVMRPLGFTADGQVQVSVTWHGITATVTIPNDVTTAEANAKAEFAKVEAQESEKRAALAAFTIG